MFIVVFCRDGRLANQGTAGARDENQDITRKLEISNPRKCLTRCKTLQPDGHYNQTGITTRQTLQPDGQNIVRVNNTDISTLL